MIKYPSKLQFRKSLGATCRSNQWSWSWVNHDKKEVYFGVSSVHEKGNSQLILGRNWKTNLKGWNKPGYPEALENISLVNEKNYELFTFRQYEKIVDQETGRVKIIKFEQDLEKRIPVERDDGWYAVLVGDFEHTQNILIDDNLTVFIEGSKIPVSGSKVERNSQAREACLKIHGTACSICNFDFRETYGILGNGFIHVHHLHAISQTKGKYTINPKTDLRPVCPNCHAMIHRYGKNRSIDAIKALIS